jgi:hypothetical protein
VHQDGIASPQPNLAPAACCAECGIFLTRYPRSYDRDHLIAISIRSVLTCASSFGSSIMPTLRCRLWWKDFPIKSHFVHRRTQRSWSTPPGTSPSVWPPPILLPCLSSMLSCKYQYCVSKAKQVLTYLGLLVVGSSAGQVGPL